MKVCVVLMVVVAVFACGVLAVSETALAQSGKFQSTDTGLGLLANWYTIPDFWFMLAVVWYYFRNERRQQDDSLRLKWTTVYHAFPTMQLYVGSHLPTDKPGVSELCHDWGKGKTGLAECWETMVKAVSTGEWLPLEPVQEPTWQQAVITKVRKLPWTLFPVAFAGMIYVTFHYATWTELAQSSDPTFADSGTSLCPPLYSATLPGGNMAPFGSIANGDIDGFFMPPCGSGRGLNAVCDVVCRPNYALNMHSGSVAACGVVDNQLDWLPLGFQQSMCSPDILMAIPGLEVHLRSDLGTPLRDFSGNLRNPVTTANVQVLGDRWTFSKNDSIGVVSNLPGEAMYLRSGAPDVADSSLPPLSFGLFVVGTPSSMQDLMRITDIVNWNGMLNTTSMSAQCINMMTSAPSQKVISFLASFSSLASNWTQQLSLRINGRSCMTTRTPNGPLASTTWHQFSSNSTSSMVLGCGYSTSGNRTANCPLNRQYSGTISEVVFYANGNWNATTPCWVGNENSMLLGTGCVRHKVEAVEYFLAKKFQIALTSGVSQGTCQVVGNTHTVCNPDCSGLDC
eukprot:c4221_g1_i1.p1 GENE.c4221_g1_i1~~c4221_g1_i1.p1  ORF type:complete len:567 (-),score=150.50 c4221_g1_i1:42-1742(-)